MTLATVVRAGDLFDNLNDESEQPKDRRIEIVQSGELANLIRLFKEYLPEARENMNVEETYLTTDRIINVSVPSRIITEFGVVLPGYCSESDLTRESMIFVSSAMNRSADLSHVLMLNSFPAPPDDVGYGLALGKSLEVYGDCGNFAGYGNKGNQVFRGNCRDFAGMNNDGAQRFIGEVRSFSCVSGTGTIYHRGKLIVENGRTVE